MGVYMVSQIPSGREGVVSAENAADSTCHLRRSAVYASHDSYQMWAKGIFEFVPDVFLAGGRGVSRDPQTLSIIPDDH